jgi:hypothetical protein
MRHILLTLLLAALCACASVPSAPSTTADHVVIVRRFVDAFNAHDVNAMAALIARDAQWLSIDGDKINVEAGSRAAIRGKMTSYFNSCPGCRSQVTKITTTANRVSTVEIATWESLSGPKSQSTLAIYEFEGNLIRRVYYFPEER